MSYTNILSSGSWDGRVGSIRIRWSNSGAQRLLEFARDNRVSAETVKALCEHFGYATAYRLGNDQAVLSYVNPRSRHVTTFLINNNRRGPPHKDSVNSANGQVSADDLHVRVNTNGGGGGTYKVHIYIDGVGQGTTAYDNVHVRAESVMKRTKSGYVIDTRQSYGSVSLAGTSGAATSGGSNAASSSNSAGQYTGYSEWQWDAGRGKYIRYNYTTQQWEET
jgi:hypothetical protein